MLNGTNGHQPIPLHPTPSVEPRSRLEQTLSTLDRTLHELVEGEMDASLGRAIADVAKTIAEITRDHELEERLTVVEEARHGKR